MVGLGLLCVGWGGVCYTNGGEEGTYALIVWSQTVLCLVGPALLTPLLLSSPPSSNTTGYAVDITVPSLRLAIEADGPSHFSRTPGPPSTTSGSSSSSNTKPPSGRLLQVGATAMKRRHLSLLGWTVVNIPYSEWDRQSDEQQRVAYLKQRIAAARKAADGGGAGGAGGATAK